MPFISSFLIFESQIGIFFGDEIANSNRYDASVVEALAEKTIARDINKRSNHRRSTIDVMVSSSWRREIVILQILMLTSQTSSAWMGSYSKTCQRRGGTTSLLLNPFGHQESNNISVNRRKLISLLPTIAITTTLPNTAEAKCKPSNELINARMQLDLAVQASQSWVDAEEIANDALLDEKNLLSALKSCNNNTSRGDEVISKVLESVKKMRSIVAKEGKNTDDAMTFMKYGTSARTAVDSYLNSD